MKKSLLLGIVGLAAGVAASYGQGYIVLDNYNSNGGSGGPLVSYGPNVPMNGVSGALGALGTGLNSSWTAGIYFVIGTPSITDPTGTGIPDATLGLGTGGGSTAQFAAVNVFGTLGEFLAANPFLVGGTGGVTPTITAELVAYPTAAGSYAAAGFRAHSAPFTVASNAGTSPSHPLLGDAFQVLGPLTVAPVPEPTTLALGALGGLSLLLFRRKKA
jgi:hypothetical protein